jgi:hypothetical protein
LFNKYVKAFDKKALFISSETDPSNRLQELDLTDNVISTVQENAFAHLPQLHTIKINSDSMLCDCYLKWFPRWRIVWRSVVGRKKSFRFYPRVTDTFSSQTYNCI